MFAGHIGVGLALGRAERRVNVAVFVGAALLLDAILWLLVLAGWESVAIPADFERSRQPVFDFPVSHGLAGALAWSAVAAAVAGVALGRLRVARVRAAALIGIAVLSHWVLDAAVHRAELPLAGSSSPKVGLALWDALAVGLGIEVVIAFAGAWLFLAGTGLPRARAFGVAAATFALAALTVAGMTLAPPPPSAAAMAGSSLATIAAVCALYAWLAPGRRD